MEEFEFQKWWNDNGRSLCGVGNKDVTWAAWQAATKAERLRTEELAINAQRSISVMPSVKKCITYNEACRDIADLIRKG